MISNNKMGRRICSAIVILLALSCILPLLLLIISSFTQEDVLLKFGYSLFPRKTSIAAYAYLLRAGATIFKAYGVTLFTTAVGTIACLFLTVTMAYPLSRKDLFGRTFFAFYVFVTMIFNGGLVPTYMMWVQVFHIRDTIWAQIVPGLLLSGFSVIMVRSYFTANIPEEIIESARIDGANHFTVLNKIVMPLSKPILATIGLMSGLAYWNNWTNGLYYIVHKTEYYNIQNVLNQMLKNVDFLKNQATSMGALFTSDAVPGAGIRMAVACLALLPVLIIYPFVQKAFVRGIVVGGVKG